MTNHRLFYLWCVLAIGIVLIAILPDSNVHYLFLGGYESNRWGHFLAFGAVTAIPVAAWKVRTKILFSLTPAVVAIALELWRLYTPGTNLHAQNVPADLFGIAGGILLGLNLRAMRHSASSNDSRNSGPNRSTT